MSDPPACRSVTVAGRELTFPVQVRAARSWAAQFLLPASAAQAVVDPTGLDVLRVAPRRAMGMVIVVRYEDTDLDAYNEVGVAFLVRSHDSRKPAIYIHHLPVDQEFTLAAGREVWGYPKFMSSIDIAERADGMTCRLGEDGSSILSLSVATGRTLPMPPNVLPTYTNLDGTLRRTEWTMPGVSVRGRLGGARLSLGDHPIAEEMRAAGFGTRAVACQVIGQMRARFGPASRVE